MTVPTYAALLEHLASLREDCMHPGLDRMTIACARLGHPERAVPTIHIAGTNGKGSTGAFLRALLNSTGLRVGHYTSPHLIDFTERIAVDGCPISGERLAHYGSQIIARSEELALSYFEFATLLAFCAFADARPDIAIIEVGLGGRWDATNVITPRVSVITPIGMDHQQHLGDTIAAIAREKCGIIKPGVPVVSAPQEPAVMDIIRATCAERNALLTVAEPTPVSVPLGLPGAHQRVNAGVAHAVVKMMIPSPLSGRGQGEGAGFSSLATACWPARCEWLSHDPPILFDGAHNPHAAAALATYLAEVRQDRSITCVLGVLRDKDSVGIVRALAPVVDQFITVTPPSPRALPAEELAAIIRTQGGKVQSVTSMKEVLQAVTKHEARGTLHVITGSLYLYAPVRALSPGSLEG